MDRFWCSRCLNDRVEVPDMIRLFAGGATTPLVVKIGTKQPWVKIEYSRNFDRNFALFGGKIWLGLFYNFFCVMVPRFYTKNSSHFDNKWRRDGHFSENLYIMYFALFLPLKHILYLAPSAIWHYYIVRWQQSLLHLAL